MRVVAAVAALALLVAVPTLRSFAQPTDCITIANFATNAVGGFPSDWKARKDEGKQVYAVQAEGGLRFLRAVSKALGIQAAKEKAWDLAAYPVLAW